MHWRKGLAARLLNDLRDSSFFVEFTHRLDRCGANPPPLGLPTTEHLPVGNLTNCYSHFCVKSDHARLLGRRSILPIASFALKMINQMVLDIKAFWSPDRLPINHSGNGASSGVAQALSLRPAPTLRLVRVGTPNRTLNSPISCAEPAVVRNAARVFGPRDSSFFCARWPVCPHQPLHSRHPPQEHRTASSLIVEFPAYRIVGGG